MGFKLGTALGKLASSAIRQATGGVIRPSFVKPKGTAMAVQDPAYPFNIGGPGGISIGRPTWPPGPGVTMPGQDKSLPPGWNSGMGGLTPMAIAAYCALSTGGGKMRLAPSPCRGFHWNESRYHVFGRCGEGEATVERGTKLVRNRGINPANAQAARRAVRRLVGTHRLLVSIERSIKPLAGRVARRGGAGGRSKSCGCKGKCSC